MRSIDMLILNIPSIVYFLCAAVLAYRDKDCRRVFIIIGLLLSVITKAN